MKAKQGQIWWRIPCNGKIKTQKNSIHRKRNAKPKRIEKKNQMNETAKRWTGMNEIIAVISLLLKFGRQQLSKWEYQTMLVCTVTENTVSLVHNCLYGLIEFMFCLPLYACNNLVMHMFWLCIFHCLFCLFVYFFFSICYRNFAWW